MRSIHTCDAYLGRLPPDVGQSCDPVVRVTHDDGEEPAALGAG